MSNTKDEKCTVRLRQAMAYEIDGIAQKSRLSKGKILNDLLRFAIDHMELYERPVYDIRFKEVPHDTEA